MEAAGLGTERQPRSCSRAGCHEAHQQRGGSGPKTRQLPHTVQGSYGAGGGSRAGFITGGGALSAF